MLIDQVSKTWVKTNMFIGQDIPVLGEWFILRFIENNGMAFGIEFQGIYGKLFLTLFRIAAVTGIGYFLWKLVKKNATTGAIVSLSLIFAGATGNIIDSIFYGVIYRDINDYEGSWFYGQVVDMLYFPVIKGYIPDWSPIWKNEYFIFFRPIFNVADTAISTGVFAIILFQKRFFPEDKKPTNQEVVSEDVD